MRTPKLSTAEVAERLTDLPGWQIDNGALKRTFGFEDFAGSMAFVNRLADAAEAADHHPDIDIRYNKVTIALSTHDSGGITEKDFALAQQADAFVTE